MVSKLSLNIIDKVLPHLTLNKQPIARSINNLKILYNHNEDNFVISLTHSNKDQRKNKSSDINKSNYEITHSIHKNSFIKCVLNSFKVTEPAVECKPQNIVMDFSSPNVAKPFHAGHLRSTIIGNFIANINMYYNNNVTRINYLGDWGTQFGLLQCGLQAKNVNINDLKINPMKTLYDAYVYANKLASTDDYILTQARKYFSDIEQGRSNLEEWQKVREVTVKELEKVYQRLGIQFDAYHWESDYNGGAIKHLIDSLEKAGIIRSDESGQKVATINNKDVTILKSDQSTLYISRDIAALLDRYEKYKFDKMLYVVDYSQSNHFTAVFQIVKQINEQCTNRCEHVKFGRIKGMSTRAGNVVFLNDILDEAKYKVHKLQMLSKNARSSAKNEETWDILGTSAVVINDLKRIRQKDYVFDWERALQSEGDSGIKLQYLHCRLWSLEQRCGVPLPEEIDPELLPEEIVGIVLAELAKFEYILHQSLTTNEASIIISYLFRLAARVNRMFNELKVKDVDSDLAEQRLLVFHSSRLVVKTALEILGLKPLYEM